MMADPCENEPIFKDCGVGYYEVLKLTHESVILENGTPSTLSANIINGAS